jgi:hypothetical protein
MIAKNLIVLLTLLVVGCVGMFSWFTNTTKANADGVSMTCNAPDGLEIAIVEHGADAPTDDDYQVGELTLTKDKYEFLSDLSLTEIASDGVTFMKPMLIQSGSNAYPDCETEWDTATPQLHYLSFDLYVRSKAEMDVYLDTSSKFSPVSNNLIGANAGNKSSYGNFSKDYIVGAARFSVLASDNTTRKLLWIPRPDILLVSSDDGFTVNQGTIAPSSKEHFYYILENGIYKKNQIPSSEITLSTRSSTADPYHLAKDVDIISLSGSKDSKGYYVNHVVCNMWIDGDDAEARLALVGGQFTMDLNLGINKK